MKTFVAALALAAAGTVVTSAPSQALPAWTVTIQPVQGSVVLGHKMNFTGTVDKSAAGKRVKLQERPGPGKTWQLQRFAVVQADGSYATWDKPTTTHTRQYRVVMPETKTHKAGVSPVATIDVYSWRSLLSFGAMNNRNMSIGNTVSIAESSYLDSIATYSWTDGTTPTTHRSTVEFNLDYRCRTMKMTFGLSDSSDADSSADVSILLNTDQAYEHTFVPGDSEQETFNVENVLKVHFDATSTIPGKHALAAVGTPQVLCHD